MIPSINEMIPSINEMISSINEMIPSINEMIPSINEMIPSINISIIEILNKIKNVDVVKLFGYIYIIKFSILIISNSKQYCRKKIKLIPQINNYINSEKKKVILEIQENFKNEVKNLTLYNNIPNFGIKPEEIENLFQLNFVPIVNENDSIATSEIKFGDNDRLASRVAQISSAAANRYKYVCTEFIPTTLILCPA